MAEDKGPNFWNEMVLSPVLTSSEKALRDKFVTEYLIDYDAWAAALRVGFIKSVAATYAEELMADPYVRQQLTERQRKIAADPKAEALENRRRTEMALLREAHYKGPGSTHSARVQALAKLASIYDMDAPIKTKNETTHRGGVMLVPAPMAAKDWEKAALDSQGALQEDARH